MAETYITDEDRYVTPRVSQGNAYEDVNTRAAANLGTMSGQMTLLKMQELQNSVSAQDLGRRKAIFEEDQRSKKQAEADDFSGFLSENAEAGDINKMAETYARRNPNIFNNEDAMQTLGNLNKSQARMNQIRTDAMEGRNLDFEELHEEERREADRKHLGLKIDTIEKESQEVRNAIFAGENETIVKTGALLGNPAMDSFTRKNLADTFSDLRSSSLITDEKRKELMPVLLRLGSSFSALSQVKEIEKSKLSVHGGLHASLAREGINISFEDTDEVIDAKFKAALKLDPKKANALIAFRNDFLESRTAQNEINGNEKIFNEKLSALNELSKRVQEGDNSAQIDYNRAFNELAISAGTIEGVTGEITSAHKRRREQADEDADIKLKSGRLLKYNAEASKNLSATDKAQEDKEIAEAERSTKAVGTALRSAEDGFDEAKAAGDSDKMKEFQKKIDRFRKIQIDAGEGSSVPRTGSSGINIPR